MQLPPPAAGVPRQLADDSSHIRLPALMTYILARSIAVTLACGVAVRCQHSSRPPHRRPRNRATSAWSSATKAIRACLPKLAVPAFIALTNDAETQRRRQRSSARCSGTISSSRRDAHDSAGYVPDDPAAALPSIKVPLDRWKELNADAVLVGSVAKTPKGVPGEHAADQRRERRVGDGARIQRQCHRHPGQPGARLCAHHRRRSAKEQRGLNGIAHQDRLLLRS